MSEYPRRECHIHHYHVSWINLNSACKVSPPGTVFLSNPAREHPSDPSFRVPSSFVNGVQLGLSYSVALRLKQSPLLGVPYLPNRHEHGTQYRYSKSTYCVVIVRVLTLDTLSPTPPCLLVSSRRSRPREVTRPSGGLLPWWTALVRRGLRSSQQASGMRGFSLSGVCKTHQPPPKS
ncbi:uncharacterized protein BO72DRAFT_206329 [Aspergillus fijiensis CBS 313.89]|uniref:Uncharacterized protein n=1 Tax=Aspergillus fijiensis CBS 313.89 TaxID=1448319 RepID=A0A8G1RY35_9EURO|nr:uncharacterized protein BO72DRAFT_206329 [Aspergillus fijiensis CBS 313.89]RAK81339.1 hypothetical protein BO72DRAFT_206329 [Aspergillus fijiensis CBS 313.89]